MFRKVIFATPATAVLLAAVPVKQSEVKAAEKVQAHTNFTCKPSDLPLYQSLHELHSTKTESHPPKDSPTRQTIESGISVVRTEVQAGLNVLAEQKAHFDHYYETAKAHTQSTIDYLNEPQNILPRSGAIAVGGLSGFIFAARGGFIKKVLYTTIGAGTVASLCYPKQAEIFARDALVQARKGYYIAYNFVKGVKPGDEVTPEPVSKFPTSMEDLKYLALDLYDEAKEAIFGKKQ
ncbi:MICOS complex subunit MIC27 [Bactrocera oleae]|uniref:MICOS complex subunit MIC27 n=1 Tax=Bactrocera oleae TaxID=104688 RepID=UPI0006B86C5A|nr:MICOS complex subunit MIC27 [Bactrocera oleae]XP_014094778.1 MICOS complex subunit MIC27 [Bactrocera oleae]XP_036228990.1 MICOS complex subunit MIC27 [Bactrocera oleae]